MKRNAQGARFGRRALVALLAVCVAVVLCACGGSTASAAPTGGSGSGSSATSGSSAASSSSATGADFTQPEHLTLPVVDLSAGNIDASHVNEGYVVVGYSSAARLKFQVAKGDTPYNYDIPNDGTPSVISVNMGDGDYRFRIMKNVSGNDYVEAEAVEANVQLTSEFVPFLLPTQFCWYNEDSACVAKARELTADATNEGEAVRNICEFIADTVTYDTDKAAVLATASGYVPEPDETLSTRKGVCFDYAALGGAMLRSMGIPTKVMTGYVSPGDLYHAWIMVYVDGSWQTVLFKVDPSTWSRVDLTFASAGTSEYTGDGASYVDRYSY